ncbi:NADH dehydrogenase [ubiquinone] 1 beta subcomplex subunit 3-like [Dreissena polymorpha]|uniref:Complex I-B12 n=1 Tax=Dreissena polymorpha TaxID=45954 RepID=A0A9D4DMR2_DREPO|nr:NADH dehydrogenase [ubiquinone] 1 beta subcomplex subunit 3-like [Dreissena polymorpha]KAH3751933.1 hypothetical protein DPMN_186540 [Dreissena polymorpha]
MGGGGHHFKINIPDYKKYKVEDVPELVKLQKDLAKRGLKDPWARNHVWKFQNELLKDYPKWQHLFRMPGPMRGIWVGLGLTFTIIAVDQMTGAHFRGHH